MIHVESLTKRYGLHEALSDVTFDIARGETVGLLGENGAGKSTTMRIVACYIPPTSGTVIVAGHDAVFESMAARRNIGYLPETVPLYGVMRVEEFLLFRARLKGLGRRDAKAALERALDRVGLRERRRSLIQTLSKGLRQRVGFADALIHDPPVIILDEPTSGLDPTQRLEVRRLIGELREHHTILISSHILPEIESTCDRVVVLSKGKLIAQRGIEELRRLTQEARFKMRVRGSLESLTAVIRSRAGLVLVNSTERDGCVDAEIAAGADAEADREAVVRAAVAAGLGVLEVTPTLGTVEAAYFRLLRTGAEA